jgi:hypothetical protein
MRFYFPNTERPKSAAKWLRRLKGDIQFSQALEAVAKATGYRDWYELSHIATPLDQPNVPPLDAVRDVILSISSTLGMSIGDVQFAVSKSRLLVDQPLSIEDMLQVRAKLWRARLFGASARGKPGTVVRIKSPGENGVGYLKAAGRPTYVVLDNGVGIRADHEVITPRIPLPDFVPSRLWLPYGYWTLTDGSTVTYSRDYKPLWHMKGGQVIRMDPWIWVPGIIRHTYFPSSTVGELSWDANPARSRAITHLEENRLFDPPKLLDAMHYLFESGVDSVDAAVSRLQETELGLQAA